MVKACDVLVIVSHTLVDLTQDVGVCSTLDKDASSRVSGCAHVILDVMADFDEALEGAASYV